MSIKMLYGVIVLSVFSLGLSGCATTPIYAWTKDGVSQQEVQDAYSKCEYEILLNKTDKDKQQELSRLCMQGKGFHMTRVQ